jgi:pimeloyl-ACP methyl ester carboxylesterase
MAQLFSFLYINPPPVICFNTTNSWADQVISFIEDVLLPNHPCKDGHHVKIHLVGNSVGGHLSVLLALKRPDLIESICLLNATPVWGLNLPGWSGEKARRVVDNLLFIC